MESGDVFVDSTPHFVAFCLYVFVFVVVLIGINSSCLYLMIIFTFFFLQRVARVGRHLSHVLHPLYPARRPLSDPTSRSRRMHVRQLMPRITASMAPRVSQSKSESPFSTIASKLHSLYISFFSPPSQPLTAKKKTTERMFARPILQFILFVVVHVIHFDPRLFCTQGASPVAIWESYLSSYP